MSILHARDLRNGKWINVPTEFKINHKNGLIYEVDFSVIYKYPVNNFLITKKFKIEFELTPDGVVFVSGDEKEMEINFSIRMERDFLVDLDYNDNKEIKEEIISMLNNSKVEKIDETMITIGLDAPLRVIKSFNEKIKKEIIPSL